MTRRIVVGLAVFIGAAVLLEGLAACLIDDIGVLRNLPGLQGFEAAGEALGEADGTHEHTPGESEVLLDHVAGDLEGCCAGNGLGDRGIS